MDRPWLVTDTTKPAVHQAQQASDSAFTYFTVNGAAGRAGCERCHAEP